MCEIALPVTPAIHTHTQTLGLTPFRLMFIELNRQCNKIFTHTHTHTEFKHTHTHTHTHTEFKHTPLLTLHVQAPYTITPTLMLLVRACTYIHARANCVSGVQASCLKLTIVWMYRNADRLFRCFTVTLHYHLDPLRRPLTRDINPMNSSDPPKC